MRITRLINLSFTTLRHWNYQFSEEEPIEAVERFAQGHNRAGEQPWLKYHTWGPLNSIKPSNSQKPKYREAWSCCQVSIYHMRQDQYFCKQGTDLVSFAGVFQGLFWAHIPGQDHDCQQGQSRRMLQGAVLDIWLAAGYVIPSEYYSE